MLQTNHHCGTSRLISNSRLAFLTIILLLSEFLAAAHAVPVDLAHSRYAFLPSATGRTTQNEKDVRVLEQAKPIERELAGGQAHGYRCTLIAGQYLHVVVDQRGIDVVVGVFDPGDKNLVEVDSPNGSQGPEEVGVIAKLSGDYRLTVRSLDKSAGAGRYEIGITELRTAAAKDHDYIAASKAFAEAYQLYFQDTAESLRSAIRKLEEARPLWQSIGNRAKESDTLDGIGTIYSKLGEKRRALEYYELALPLRRAIGDRRGEAATLSNIGFIYSDLSENGKALDFYKQALSIQGEVGDEVGQSITLNNIAVVYNEMGENQLALDHYLQSLNLHRDQDGGTINNIGTIYDELGEEQKALDYFNQALTIRRSAGDRRGEAQTLNNIGGVHSDLRESQKALDYYNQALALRRSVGDRRGEGVTLNNIGTTYRDIGELQKALDYLGQSLKINRAVENRRIEAHSLDEIGRIYDALGQPQKALDYYSQSLTLRRAVGDRHGEATTLHNIAHSERNRGDLSAARSYIEAAIDIVESLRIKVDSQELRASYFASVHDFFGFYIDLLMRLHKQRPAEGHDAIAIQASERARARSLLELLTGAGAYIRQGVDPEFLERERTLRQLLNTKAERQMRLLSGPHTKEQASEAAKEIEALRIEYQQVQAQIRLKSPRYAALTQPQPLNLKEIQTKVLEPDTLLLEYALGEERSYLWAVTPTSLTSFELPKRAEIEIAARNVYELLTARSQRVVGETSEARRERIAQADANYPITAAALSQMLLGSAASQLGKKRLLIVGDGALQYVPFAALPTPTTMANIATGARPPLIVEHEIVSIPSASTLAVLRREVGGRRPAAKAVAVFADPVFGKDDERVQINVARNTSGRPANPRAQTAFSRDVVRAMEDVSDAESLQRLPRLYNTRSEADVISSLVSRKESMQALDFAANRATATSPELSQYRIVHFATHAFANNVHPELSGIVLSLVDEMGQPQDGFLRTNEIFNLKLPAELVVLSACRTGLGKEVKGEGLIGLTRGFMYAGTPRVMVSLWSLSDRPTAELMVRLYKKMLGTERLPPAAALRAAQVEMWRDKRWEQPYFWAGFILQGEWR